MKNRIAMTISVVVLAAAGAVYSAARAYDVGGVDAAITQEAGIVESDPGHPRHFQRFLAHLAIELDLTGAQKTEIQSIWAAERPTIQPLVRQLAQNRQQLRSVTANNQFDEAQVRALAARQAQTLAELIVAKARVKSKAYAVLTSEQRAKADQMRDCWETGNKHV